MKHFVYSVLASLVLLTGCLEPMNLSLGTPAETGRLNLSVTETGERTILPETPVFSKYEFIFEPLDGQEGHNNIPVNAGESSGLTVDLASGKWTVIARGYVYISGVTGIPNGDMKAAEGRADININSGQIHNLSINLKGGVQPDEKGILEWEITFQDGIQSAGMAVLTLEGEEANAVDLVDTPGGNTALDAGYYLLVISIDNQRPKAEVLHIYGGMTSRIERSLYGAPAFSSSDLEEYLAYIPDNTVDTPYEIILYDINIQTAFYQLYNALNGKYVNLDLGDCKGQSIPNSSNATSRPDRDKIVSIIFPSGLTSIGSSAFEGCTNLALTELPSGLTSIGGSAFNGCTSLALTELPSGLTSIGGSAFSGCTNLTSITIPAGVMSLPNGDYFNNYTGVFSGCTNLETVIFAAGSQLESIGSYAFSGCTSLALTELPSGLTSIGSSAFEGCTSLALTELPSGLTSIGQMAFSGCTSLELTELPSGLISIGPFAFRNCTSLELTELPSGLTSIDDGAFLGCTSLELTELPSGLTSIGQMAFRNCTSLELMELPSGLTSIDSVAFNGCTSLALVICHAVTPPTLGSVAFGNTHSSLQIKVPAGSVEAYKSAEGWSTYASRISAIE